MYMFTNKTIKNKIKKSFQFYPKSINLIRSKYKSHKKQSKIIRIVYDNKKKSHQISISFEVSVYIFDYMIILTKKNKFFIYF
jgi:ribosomal protein L23